MADLEGTVLREISWRVRQIPYDITYMWNLKSKINKLKQTHRY